MNKLSKGQNRASHGSDVSLFLNSNGGTLETKSVRIKGCRRHVVRARGCFCGVKPNKSLLLDRPPPPKKFKLTGNYSTTSNCPGVGTCNLDISPSPLARQHRYSLPLKNSLHTLTRSSSSASDNIFLAYFSRGQLRIIHCTQLPTIIIPIFNQLLFGPPSSWCCQNRRINAPSKHQT